MVVMVIVIVMVVMVVMVMVVMMMVMILRHYNGLFFNRGSVTALVLSAQNLLGIGNGIQQLGKRLGGLQQAGFFYRGGGGCLRAAKESER